MVQVLLFIYLFYLFSLQFVWRAVHRLLLLRRPAFNNNQHLNYSKLKFTMDGIFLKLFWIFHHYYDPFLLTQIFVSVVTLQLWPMPTQIHHLDHTTAVQQFPTHVSLDTFYKETANWDAIQTPDNGMEVLLSAKEVYLIFSITSDSRSMHIGCTLLFRIITVSAPAWSIAINKDI